MGKNQYMSFCMLYNRNKNINVVNTGEVIMGMTVNSVKINDLRRI